MNGLCEFGLPASPMCAQELLNERQGTKEWADSLNACVHRSDCELHVCKPGTAWMGIVHRSCSMYCTSVQDPLGDSHLCAWD